MPEGGRIEGRNAVLEAYRSGQTVDKLYVEEHLSDGPVRTILREAQKAGTIVSFVSKDRLNDMTTTGHHQGVIAQVTAFAYSEVKDILELARKREEPPFIVLLDGIEDPHNLGAIIRTACQAGAHGVIVTKHRSAGLTATVVRSSAGAVYHIPVAKVTNLKKTVEGLKKEGLWFVCADMDGTSMYDLDLRGPLGVVIGSEGKGVSRLMKETCDYTARVPMTGRIDSLNASVACAVLLYEAVRQRGILK